MRKKFTKRILSLVLALALMLSVAPMSVFAIADEPYNMSSDNLTISYTASDDDVDNWTIGLDTAEGVVTGGTMGIGVLTNPVPKETTITFTNEGDSDATLSFSYEITENTENTGSVSVIKEVTYDDTVDIENADVISDEIGSYTIPVAAGASAAVRLVSGAGEENTIAVKLSDIYLYTDATATTVFKYIDNGSYTVNGDEITADVTKVQSSANVYSLKANQVICHEFEGWYSSEANGFISNEEAVNIHIDADTEIYPVYKLIGHTEINDAEVPATCTKTGLTAGSHCQDCGAVIVAQEEIPVIGHDYSAPVTVDQATCTEEGSQSSTCQMCGDVQISVIDICEHTVVVDAAVPATCTENGLTEGSHCSACGEVIVAQEVIAKVEHKVRTIAATCSKGGFDYVLESCEFCGISRTDRINETPIDPNAHSLSSTVNVVAPTCTEGGYSYQKCTNNAAHTVVVEGSQTEALGHNYTKQVISSTCVGDGYTIYTCSTCGETHNDDFVAATGHNYGNWVVTEAPTCTKDGVKTATCTNCDATKTEVITATGHNYSSVVTAPTCTTQGYTTHSCSLCGDVVTDSYVDALGHDYSETVVAPTCTEQGYTEYKCAICDHEYKGSYVNAKGHSNKKIPAVEATCTETGLTQGVKCTVCGKEVIAQEVIAAKGHSFSAWTVETPATCIAEGVEKRECIVCRKVETNTISIVDHTPVVLAAKEPTYAEDGATEGSKCSVCEKILIEQNAIPKLVLDWENMLVALTTLEEYAAIYATNNPGKDATKLVLNYIRTGIDRYNDESWETIAGAPETDFIEEVRDRDFINGTFAYSLREIEGLAIDMPNGEKMVFDHLFGALNVSSRNNYAQRNTDFGSWIGDTCDLMQFCTDEKIKMADIETMVKDITENYFGLDSDLSAGFGMEDVKADLDAFYIVYQISNKGKKVSEIFASYYDAELTDNERAAYFLNNRFPGSMTKEAVREAVYNVYKENVLAQMLEANRGLKDADDLRYACCYTFADYLFEHADGLLVEPGTPEETPDDNTGTSGEMRVFSSTESTIAPGITQKINYALDSNGNQIVYFTAISDISRDDVNVYANYANNDPSQGWQMATVTQQMEAARKNHTDPSNPSKYIENYNPVVGVNGSFYNMATGDPGALLVMEGIEYSPVSRNFFAVLKNGKAIIATPSEYPTYKNDIQEAVGGYQILVKDGKNMISPAATSKAPRTNVGITADGKVVLMVIDGRQSPYSAGASDYETAQLLIDMGCVDAMQLDGGASSTFVAKQEGADDFAVANRPSDTVERYVSSSLMVVSTAVLSNEFHHAIVATPTEYITSGSEFEVSLAGVSESGGKAEIPENAIINTSDSSLAVVEGNVFKALSTGDVEIQVVVDGNIVGTKAVKIVDAPNGLRFDESSINVIYGQPTELPLIATYDNIPVTINVKDIVFEQSNAGGVISGFLFTGDETSGIRNTVIVAGVAANTDVKATITLRLYSADESVFDFKNATVGNESLAWNRIVDNAFTTDDITYYITDIEKDTPVSYTFAMDMKAIKAPVRLEPLMEYLSGFAGSGMGADGSPWDYLLALGGRVSSLTNVTIKAKFPKGVNVDVSDITFVNDFLKISSCILDEATNELTIKCNWVRQTDGIDSATANSICILSGLKITPTDDVKLNEKGMQAIEVSGNVTYDIYLDTSQLHSFASDPENQKTYGLYDYINPEDPEDAGGHFADTYITFEDNFAIADKPLDGWVLGGKDNDLSYYYVNNKMITGVYLATDMEGGEGSYYYNFGEDGICVGKYTGLFYDKAAGAYRYARLGELQSGWIEIDSDYYYFDKTTFAATPGKVRHEPVVYEFEETGRLVSGVWAKTLFGKRYYYGPDFYRKGWHTIDGKEYFFENNICLTGYQLIYYTGYERIWCYFNEDGSCDRNRKLSDGFYTDRNGLAYSKDGVGLSGTHLIDGEYYNFSYKGYARKGTYTDRLFGDDYKAYTGLIEKDGILYYYTDGRTATCGLFEYNGDYYYSYWGGVVKTDGRYYVANSYCDLPAGNYTFGSDGKMLNGVVEEDGKKYLYFNGTTASNGLYKIDGDYYCSGWGGEFKADGKYYAGKTYCDLPVGNYEFGPDGKMLNGIVEKDGIKYLYINGTTSTCGLFEVDGEYYYAYWGGILKTDGRYYVTRTYCDLPANTNYTFGEDGKMLRGVVDVNGTKYLYINGTTSTCGLFEIDGEYYYAYWGGVLKTDGRYYVTRTYCDLPANANYTFGEDGKMLRGVVDVNGTKYLYINGTTSTCGLFEIDGEYYYAYWGGVLKTDGRYYVTRTYCDLPANTNYTFGEDGKMLNGIVEIDGKKYLYKNGTTASNGLYNINGDYYYVDWGGVLKIDGRYYVTRTHCDLPANVNYTFDKDGKMLNGFVTKDNTIYYYKNGNTPRPGVVEVNGDYYFVTWSGVVVTNKTFYVFEENEYTVKAYYSSDATGKIIA